MNCPPRRCEIPRKRASVAESGASLVRSVALTAALLLSLLLCGLLPLCGFAAADQAPEAAALFADPLFLDARISPGGEYLALVENIEGHGQVAIVDLDEMKTTAARRLELNDHVYKVWWVGDERVVFSVAVKFGTRSAPLMTNKLWAMNADGSNPRQLFGAVDSAAISRSGTADHAFPAMLDPLPHDPRHALVVAWTPQTGGSVIRNLELRSRPEVWRIDVLAGSRPGERYRGETGTRIPHTRRKSLGRGPLDNGWLFVDGDGAVRIAMGYEGASFALYHRAAGDQPWEPLGSGHAVDSDVQLDPIGFDRGNRRLTVLRSERGVSTGLFAIDTKTGEETELFRASGFDLEEADLCLNRYGEVVGVNLMADTNRSYVLADDPDAELYQSLAASLSGQRVDVTSYSRDGSRAIVHAASDRNPGTYYLYDRKERSLRRLYNVLAGVDPERMASVRPIKLAARDGTQLRGYLTTPRDGPALDLPLLVLVHGGPEDRDRHAFDPEVQLLASRGFAVLQVNFRGSSGFGSEFLSAGEREWGGAMQDDVTDATRWAVDQGIADPDRICIYGTSYGAYAALMGAVREPQLYRCAAGLAGVYDLPLMFGRGDIPTYPAGEAYLDRILGRDEAQLRQRSPVYLAEQIQIPVFLAHGGKDERAHPEHFHRMRKALEQAGNPPLTLFVSEEGHGFYGLANRLAFYDRLLDFLVSHTAGRRRSEAQ